MEDIQSLIRKEFYRKYTQLRNNEGIYKSITIMFEALKRCYEERKDDRCTLILQYESEHSYCKGDITVNKHKFNLEHCSRLRDAHLNYVLENMNIEYKATRKKFDDINWTEAHGVDMKNITKWTYELNFYNWNKSTKDSNIKEALTILEKAKENRQQQIEKIWKGWEVHDRLERLFNERDATSEYMQQIEKVKKLLEDSINKT